ncbi:hypothetical protein LJ737_25905 [Hymenobacter sp. 15J16-1T3B]|uniref:hypothetical protein n=1 Tax=Hymenobacter sp. 15J16-1T3B TaxID=2886941 RepID=UPI001D1202A1|nr:hypothetical protein [Hymenobacter sp. 15J16-1T3B]MCC3160698.1 hypothetical protein [Hymenobacter sp. 15J16-1T3B]
MSTRRAEIVKQYQRATYSYALPFGLLLLGFVVEVLLPLALLVWVPLGVAGLYFSKRGLTLAVSSGDQEKQDVGYANLLLGAIVLGLGLLGWALAYVMTA